ncbi:MAG: hypothetical protein BGP25_06410 [Lysobacterales bacterium 63-13]|nr:MAG: hypothetical protein BGP25_06410 [Xanthomonadales bacterium 63-13]
MSEKPTSRASILETGMESMRQATIAARAATNALQTVTAICADLMSLEGMLTDEQRTAKAKLIRDVLLTRKLTQILKNRAEALAGKLSRVPKLKVAQRA